MSTTTSLRRELLATQLPECIAKGAVERFDRHVWRLVLPLKHEIEQRNRGGPPPDTAPCEYSARARHLSARKADLLERLARARRPLAQREAEARRRFTAWSRRRRPAIEHLRRLLDLALRDETQVRRM